MPADIHPLQDKCDSFAVEPSSQQTAQRDRARRSLAAELAPECPTGEPIQKFLPLPEAPAPSVSRDAGMAPVTPSEPPPLWENYSRFELWQMYAATNETALTRGTEVARLKRFSAAQDTLTQTSLQTACDEYNRLLDVQAEGFKTELAGHLNTYAQQLEVQFTAKQSALRAAHANQLASANTRAETNVSEAKAATSKAEFLYSVLEDDFNSLKKLCMVALAVLVSVTLYCKYFQ